MTSIEVNGIYQVYSDIEKYGLSPFVERWIGKPEIPSFFTHMCMMMLQSFQLDRDRIHTYTVATTLLQMSLLTHENVTNQEQQSDTDLKKRQLYVLAGDYYSALFYRLLALKNENAGIKCLSQAVCEVNELKVERQLVDEEVNQHIIDSKLLTALADFFHVQEDLGAFWKSLLPLLFKRCHHIKKGDHDAIENMKKEVTDILHSFRVHEEMSWKTELVRFLQIDAI
ncbi:heptaprenyl diphosphate synthase component 1 [Polycladospora coralii]|nr:heptaprenyl diphosphate synthase component 1 [Polycladospora coralii]